MPLSRASEDRMAVFDWTPLTAASTLVRYDARGHGTSTGRPVGEHYTWPALAGDLLALLDHVSAAAPVDGMGASMGCATVLWAATMAPARFRRLVLVIPPTAWETRAAAADGYLVAADLVRRLGVDAFLTAMRAAPRPEVLSGVDTYPPVPGVSAELLPSVLEGAAKSDLPDPARLAELAHPALILSWDTDPVHPVSTARRLAELLPNAELHVADTMAEVRGWGARTAAFLAR